MPGGWLVQRPEPLADNPIYGWCKLHDYWTSVTRGHRDAQVNGYSMVQWRTFYLDRAPEFDLLVAARLAQANSDGTTDNGHEVAVASIALRGEPISPSTSDLRTAAMHGRSNSFGLVHSRQKTTARGKRLRQPSAEEESDSSIEVLPAKRAKRFSWRARQAFSSPRPSRTELNITDTLSRTPSPAGDPKTGDDFFMRFVCHALQKAPERTRKDILEDLCQKVCILGLLSYQADAVASSLTLA